MFANFPSLTYIGLELLIEDVIKDIKCKPGKIDRNQVIVTNISRSQSKK